MILAICHILFLFSLVHIYLELVELFPHELVDEIALEHDFGLLLAEVAVVAVHVAVLAELILLGCVHDFRWPARGRYHELLLLFSLLSLTFLLILQVLGLERVLLAAMLELALFLVLAVHFLESLAAQVRLTAFQEWVLRETKRRLLSMNLFFDFQHSLVLI